MAISIDEGTLMLVGIGPGRPLVGALEGVDLGVTHPEFRPLVHEGVLVSADIRRRAIPPGIPAFWHCRLSHPRPASGRSTVAENAPAAPVGVVMVAVKSNVPATVGVPLMTPAASIVSPSGSAPAVTSTVNTLPECVLGISCV